MTKGLRLAALAVIGVMGLAAIPGDAKADRVFVGFRGHHSRVFISTGFGFGHHFGYFGPFYHRPVVFLPAPVVTYPVAVPVGVPVAVPVGVPVATPAFDRSYCREYQSTAVINGATQPVYGVACRQADGSWRATS